MAQINTSNLAEAAVDNAAEIPTANGGTEIPVVDGATDTTTNASADVNVVDDATDTTTDASADANIDVSPNEIELKRGIGAGGIVTDDTGEPGTWGHYSAWCQQ